MQSIKASNKSLQWVLSPYRDRFEAGSKRQWLVRKAKEYEARFVSIDSNSAAFSLYEGFDFGKALVKVRSPNNYLYIESRVEGIVFVHVRGSELVEDRILHSASDLEGTLRLTASARNTLNIEDYHIDFYGLPAAPNWKEAIEILVGSEGAVNELSNSLFDVIEPPVVDGEAQYSFGEIDTALNDLTDRKTQKVTLASIAAAVALYAVIKSGFITFEDTVERVELLDDYQGYTDAALSKSTFSSRLSQDFRIHKLLGKELPFWSAYKVIHTPNSIQYKIRPTSHLATLKDLNLFADHYGMAIQNNDDGVTMIAGIHSSPAYLNESNVRAWLLTDLTTNIIDNASDVTPFVNISVNRTFNEGSWSRRELSVLFDEASTHDLLRIASVVDGYPYPYLSFFTPCQSEGCAYDITARGTLKGTMNFTIYGDNAVSGGKTNG